ncbi:hypothetical protein DPMN_137165 [Dreissena polymorpha]|uniref:Uncharacterized protein n=1 Tax=Dreissena polymorpha TaxID=45954 RepID=A0A9D4JDD7_DREPO|nr:hypothetical protein DPMN_137165 [Dreissena polymorpha]
MSSVSAQNRFKTELLTEISKLEADISQWDDFLCQLAKPMFPKRLLLQPDPVVVTGIPIPVNVESSVSAPPKLLGLTQGRGNGTTGFHRASNGPLVPNALPVPFPSTITIPIPSNARVFNYLPGQSNSPDPSIPPTKKDRDVLTKLPKSLLYYGQSKWFVFQSKFERYARVQDWSDAECADCLGLCLLLTVGRGTVPYVELMQRLQERFGARELTATAQGRF